MKFNHKLLQAILIVAASIILSSCSARSDVVHLESFTQNGVTVSIDLITSQNGTTSLAARFEPPQGFHLYSKEIPRDGVDGLGRPTLLELAPDSLMLSAGELSESVRAQIPDFEPKDLLVYPAGAVTLTLPITLPAGMSWSDDAVSVSYMACDDRGCKAPVIDRIVSVRIPGAANNSNP